MTDPKHQTEYLAAAAQIAKCDVDFDDLLQFVPEADDYRATIAAGKIAAEINAERDLRRAAEDAAEKAEAELSNLQEHLRTIYTLLERLEQLECMTGGDDWPAIEMQRAIYDDVKTIALITA